MNTNTVQTLKDYVIDLTGLTNLSDAKFIRALNFTTDDYSRIQIFSGGKWKRDSSNHGNLSRATATVSGDKSSLNSEMIAIEAIDIYHDGKYHRVIPIDQKDSGEPLDAVYSTAGVPKYYDYDNHYIRWYPNLSGSKTARISYKRAHPRFTTSNLSGQSIGIVPIDEEFLAVGTATRLTIGSSDTAHVALRDMYTGMKNEIKDSLPKQDQDTPAVLKAKVPSVFMKSRRGN